jgi:hypothetical protein
MEWFAFVINCKGHYSCKMASKLAFLHGLMLQNSTYINHMSSSLWKAHFGLTNLKNPPLQRPNKIVDISIAFIGKKIFKNLFLYDCQSRVQL